MEPMDDESGEPVVCRTLSELESLVEADKEHLVKKLALGNTASAVEVGPFLHPKMGVLRGELDKKDILRSRAGVDMERLAQLLPTLRTLDSLLLPCNALGDIGATQLAAALSGHPSVRRLSLAFNRIGDLGAHALADMLRDNASITSCNLYGNRIGDAGARDIGRALHENFYVRDLNLGCNACSDDMHPATGGAADGTDGADSVPRGGVGLAQRVRDVARMSVMERTSAPSAEFDDPKPQAELEPGLPSESAVQDENT